MRDRLVPCQMKLGPLTYSCIRSIDLFVGSRSPLVSSQIFREDQHDKAVGTLYHIHSSRIAHHIDNYTSYSSYQLSSQCSIDEISKSEGIDLSDVVPACLKTLQHNVLSLKYGTDRTVLATLCRKHSIFYACPQESRNPKTGVRAALGHFMCSSAATNGCYGCEIWFSDTIAIGSYYKKKFVASRDSISILHASPQIAFCRSHHWPICLCVR